MERLLRTGWDPRIPLASADAPLHMDAAAYVWELDTIVHNSYPSLAGALRTSQWPRGDQDSEAAAVRTCTRVHMLREMMQVAREY